MFEMVARHFEIIFFPLTIPKGDLGVVEKAMLPVLACHFEIILGLLYIPKCDFVEVEKAIFQWPA